MESISVNDNDSLSQTVPILSTITSGPLPQLALNFLCKYNLQFLSSVYPGEHTWTTHVTKRPPYSHLCCEIWAILLFLKLLSVKEQKQFRILLKLSEKCKKKCFGWWVTAFKEGTAEKGKKGNFAFIFNSGYLIWNATFACILVICSALSFLRNILFESHWFHKSKAHSYLDVLISLTVLFCAWIYWLIFPIHVNLITYSYF